MKKQHANKNKLTGTSRRNAKIMTRLFSQHYKKFCLYAEKITRQQPEAEDIVIESFVKLWQSGESLEDLQNVKAFLYKIIYNNCINYLKKAERLRSYHASLFPGSTELPGTINEPEVLQVELMHAIYEEIEKLPKKCREVVRLLYQHQLSVEDIAGRLFISEQTVYTQKARAVKQIRAALLKRNII